MARVSKKEEPAIVADVQPATIEIGHYPFEIERIERAAHYFSTTPDVVKHILKIAMGEIE